MSFRSISVILTTVCAHFFSFRPLFSHFFRTLPTFYLPFPSELISYAGDFETEHSSDPDLLTRFLDSAVMESDGGDKKSQEAAAASLGLVTLSTMHAAKGLEWPVVFVPGLESGVIPHQRSAETPGGLDEERRLLYVAMTRAQALLYMSYVGRRTVNGDSSARRFSPFLYPLVRAGEPMQLGCKFVGSCRMGPPTIGAEFLVETDALLHKSVFSSKKPLENCIDYVPAAVVERVNTFQFAREQENQEWKGGEKGGAKRFLLFENDIDLYDGDEASLPMTSPMTSYSAAPVRNLGGFQSARSLDRGGYSARDAVRPAGFGAMSAGFTAASSLKRAYSDTWQPSPKKVSPVVNVEAVNVAQVNVQAVAQRRTPVKKAASDGNHKLTSFFSYKS